MADKSPPPKNKSEPSVDETTSESTPVLTNDSHSSSSSTTSSPKLQSVSVDSQSRPTFSRKHSYSSSQGHANAYSEDFDSFLPPLDKITILDLLENIDLPRRLEKWQTALNAQKERYKHSRDKLKSKSIIAKDRMIEEWRKRVPPEEQLDKYRKRMRQSVDRIGERWNDSQVVSAREKLSFIAGVLNILISGWLIGAYPQYFYMWFTAQFLYYMPIRYYTYHKKGYHYFLADLCYFVNLLTLLSLWVFPASKRLFISTYCLAYGNNAVAIAMWRNSMVFHSVDKMTSLFIHLMPPVTLHCIVHLTPNQFQQMRFPAVHAIRTSAPGSPTHYRLPSMILWSSLPYIIWQLNYHIFITVRRREKIAAGRPTSFTWLRRSYARTWIGKLVLALPGSLQEPAFMLIQYMYALLTMIPCPLWFWFSWASSVFLMAVFIWSVYNGATFYLDVLGKKFEKELEQLKRDVAKWQSSPEEAPISPNLIPLTSEKELSALNNKDDSAETGTKASSTNPTQKPSLENIPLLDAKPEASNVDSANIASKI